MEADGARPILGGMRLPLPLAAREQIDDFEERLARVPTQLNEYGYDPFGLQPEFLRRFASISVFLYRYYHRVETHGIENVPEGRALLIGNHAGNTIPMDGGLLFLSMLLEAEPPRICRVHTVGDSSLTVNPAFGC